MIEPLRIEWEIVRLSQRGPAIAAIHELVGEPDPQIRMLAQVRDARNAPRFSMLRTHPQRIGVVEAELAGHADAMTGQHIGQGGGRYVGIGQDLLDERAGVFGVRIDVATHERLPQKARAAQLFAMLHLQAGIV